MLKDLELRIAEDKLKAVYERLKRGDTPYSIYAGVDALSISKVTAYKLQKLYQGKYLDFLEPLPWDDPDAGRRYEIIATAEALAPEHFFSLKHLRPLGYKDEECLEIMRRYDEHRLVRDKCVITKQGEMRMYAFAEIYDYLQLLYWAHFRSRYPEEEAAKYIIEVVRILCSGLLTANELYIRLGHCMMRYEGWRGQPNQEYITKTMHAFCKDQPEFISQWNELLESKEMEFSFRDYHIQKRMEDIRKGGH